MLQQRQCVLVGSGSSLLSMGGVIWHHLGRGRGLSLCQLPKGVAKVRGWRLRLLSRMKPMWHPGGMKQWVCCACGSFLATPHPAGSPRSSHHSAAAPWDDAAQEAGDCHLQAALLAAAQAGKKNSTEKGFKDVLKESSLIGESPS